jgi:putative membrane protein
MIGESHLAATIAVTAVAALHLVFLILEMFLWTKPIGRRIFGLKREFAEQTATLAANQGLYNGFLAAGLLWGLLSRQPSNETTIFFLVCIIVAGVYGALTVKRTILFVQALPGAIALLLVLTSG